MVVVVVVVLVLGKGKGPLGEGEGLEGLRVSSLPGAADEGLRVLCCVCVCVCVCVCCGEGRSSSFFRDVDCDGRVWLWWRGRRV